MVEVFQYKSCWHSQQNDTRKGRALGEQGNTWLGNININCINSSIFIDNSFGYINNMNALSNLIHEFNSTLVNKLDDKNKILEKDTHSLETIKNLYDELIYSLIKNGNLQNFFDNFKIDSQGNWMPIFTNETFNLLYLNFYLSHL